MTQPPFSAFRSTVRRPCGALLLFVVTSGVAGCAATDRDEYYASRRTVITAQAGDHSARVTLRPGETPAFADAQHARSDRTGE